MDIKIFKTMDNRIKQFIEQELKLYHQSFSNKDFEKAFSNLERIHIVSQPFVIPHTVSHLYMLRFALQTLRPKEIIVQVFYTLLGGILSFIGLVPIGNTGGANAISKGKMEVPEDLKQYI